MTQLASHNWPSKVESLNENLDIGDEEAAKQILSDLAGCPIEQVIRLSLTGDHPGRYNDVGRTLSEDHTSNRVMQDPTVREWFGGKVANALMPGLKRRRGNGVRAIAPDYFRKDVKRAVLGLFGSSDCKKTKDPLDYATGVRKSTALDEGESISDPGDFVATTDDSFDRVLDLEALQSNFAVLLNEVHITGNEFDILHWIHQEEGSFKAAEKAWGIPEPTLKARYYRVIKRLHRAAKRLNLDI